MCFWPLIFRQKAPTPALILSYIVARRFGKFRVIVNIADNRKAVAVGAQVIQKLHGVNGKNTVGSYSEAFVGFFNKHNVMRAGVVCRLLFGEKLTARSTFGLVCIVVGTLLLVLPPA